MHLSVLIISHTWAGAVRLQQNKGDRHGHISPRPFETTFAAALETITCIGFGQEWIRVEAIDVYGPKPRQLRGCVSLMQRVGFEVNGVPSRSQFFRTMRSLGLDIMDR